MIDRIVMPSMGATGEDVVIVEWLVKEGDLVNAGQPIFVAETDKATTEVEAFRAGYIRKILIHAGETAALGDTLAIVADTLEEPLDTPADETAVSRMPTVPDKEPLASSSAMPPMVPAGRIQASPLARRLAKEQGVNLASIKAEGPVHKRDVLAAAASRDRIEGKKEQRFEFTPMRRAIAARTLQSKTQSPHFYVTARIDMTEAAALQRELAGRCDQAERPTVTDMVIRAAALALRETPELNASCQDGQMVRYADINIGLVIGLAEGMLIPVVKQADVHDLQRLAAMTKRLRDQAVAGTLAQADLSGGTFTISNLGMFGIDSFIAVINPPEAGILALGAIRPEPAVVEDRIVVRSMMTATLSADHRVADGITAARFMGQLRQLLEDPAMLLPTKEMH